MRSYVHRALEASRKRNVVVSPNPEDILNHIALAIDIHSVGWNLNGAALFVFFNELHFQIFQNLADLVCSNLAAHQSLHTGIVQFYCLLLYWLGDHVLHRTGNLSAGKFKHQHGSPLQSVWNHIRIASPLETETCLGLQSMTL